MTFGEVARNVLGGIGYALDTPGAMTRAALLNAMDALTGEDRFQGWRASGRDILERAGYAPNTPGLDMGDVLGFGVETVLDPLNFIPGTALANRMLRGIRVSDEAARAAKIVERAQKAVSDLGRSGQIAKQAINTASANADWEMRLANAADDMRALAMTKKAIRDQAAEAQGFLSSYVPGAEAASALERSGRLRAAAETQRATASDALKETRIASTMANMVRDALLKSSHRTLAERASQSLMRAKELQGVIPGLEVAETVAERNASKIHALAERNLRKLVRNVGDVVPYGKTVHRDALKGSASQAVLDKAAEALLARKAVQRRLGIARDVIPVQIDTALREAEEYAHRLELSKRYPSMVGVPEIPLATRLPAELPSSIMEARRLESLADLAERTAAASPAAEARMLEEARRSLAGYEDVLREVPTRTVVESKLIPRQAVLDKPIGHFDAYPSTHADLADLVSAPKPISYQDLANRPIGYFDAYPQAYSTLPQANVPRAVTREIPGDFFTPDELAALQGKPLPRDFLGTPPPQLTPEQELIMANARKVMPNASFAQLRDAVDALVAKKTRRLPFGGREPVIPDTYVGPGPWPAYTAAFNALRGMKNLLGQEDTAL